MWLEPTLNAKFNFSDVPYEEGLEWAKKSSEHSTVSFTGELTYPGYKDVPVSYMFTENDKTVPPEMQRTQIETMERENGKQVVVYAIPTGHFPYVSSPDIVADTIKRAAGEMEYD